MVYRGSVKDQEEYENILKILQNKKGDLNLTSRYKMSRLELKSKKFTSFEDRLFLLHPEGNKEVIPCSFKEKQFLLAKSLHEVAHVGMNKLEQLAEKCYFKISREVIRDVISKCVSCAQAQPLKTKDKMVHIKAFSPGERFQIDLIDMRQFSNNNDNYNWLFVLIDIYSKFCIVKKLKDKSGDSVTQAFQSVIYKYGPPKILQSDNGKEFKNEKMEKLCENFKIVRKFGRPRYPQSQGQVERLNQTICRFLQKNLFASNSKRWIDLVDLIVYNYNITLHSATKKSPFQLFYSRLGFNINFTEIYDTKNGEDNSESEAENCSGVLVNIENVTSLNKNCEIDNVKYYQKMRRNALVHVSKYDFKIGDSVLVKKDFDTNKTTKKGKLDSFYSKLGKIVVILSNNRADVEIDGKIERFLLCQLKKVKK